MLRVRQDLHCRAIDAAYRKGVPGEVYNIGGHEERTNLDMANNILELLGKPHSLINFTTDRLGHDRRYAIDPAKSECELGWMPMITLDKGLEQTVRWYIDHRSWWERVQSGAYKE